MTITLKGGPADGTVCDFPDGHTFDCIVSNVDGEPYTYDTEGIYVPDV